MAAKEPRQCQQQSRHQSVGQCERCKDRSSQDCEACTATPDFSDDSIRFQLQMYTVCTQVTHRYHCGITGTFWPPRALDFPRLFDLSRFCPFAFRVSQVCHRVSHFVPGIFQGFFPLWPLFLVVFCNVSQCLWKFTSKLWVLPVDLFFMCSFPSTMIETSKHGSKSVCVSRCFSCLQDLPNSFHVAWKV